MEKSGTRAAAMESTTRRRGLTKQSTTTMHRLFSSKQSTKIPGRPIKEPAVSPLFEGTSIFSYMKGSSVGAFQAAIQIIFPSIPCGALNEAPGAPVAGAAAGEAGPAEDGKLTRASFKLPRVTVIGTEKSGKSTLIENITKCAIFPRDSGLCTKMPIKLSLMESAEEEMVVIEWRGETKRVEKGAILKEVTLIMNNLGTEEIVEDELTVTISGPGIPNFEFIDLPGIREFGRKGSEASVRASRELTERYLSEENTLVLVVVPATVTTLNSNQGIASVIAKGKAHQVRGQARVISRSRVRR
jgi:Dynamin family